MLNACFKMLLLTAIMSLIVGVLIALSGCQTATPTPVGFETVRPAQVEEVRASMESQFQAYTRTGVDRELLAVLTCGVAGATAYFPLDGSKEQCLLRAIDTSNWTAREFFPDILNGGTLLEIMSRRLSLGAKYSEAEKWTGAIMAFINKRGMILDLLDQVGSSSNSPG